MSVLLLLRGPDSHQRQPCRPLSQTLHSEIITSLVDRAVCAGRTLAIRSCRDDDELLAALAMVAREPPEILLLDPGAALASPRVCEALRRIAVPFVEIHDDTSLASEPELQEAPRNRVAVVHGYLAQSYTVAMSIALETIGCDECEWQYHVGT